MDINSSSFWSRSWYEEIPYEKYGNPVQSDENHESDSDKSVGKVDINIPFGWVE